VTNIEELETLRSELIEGLKPVHQIIQRVIDELQGTDSEENEKRLIWLSKELSGYNLDEEPDATIIQNLPNTQTWMNTFISGL